jgi:hypothetical protein
VSSSTATAPGRSAELTCSGNDAGSVFELVADDPNDLVISDVGAPGQGLAFVNLRPADDQGTAPLLLSMKIDGESWCVD